MKKIIGFILAAALAAPFPALADEPIKVYVQDKQIEFDAQPEIVNSRTFVPLRAIAEALGTDVQWDENTRCVTLSKNGTQTELTIDSIITRTSNSSAVGHIEAPPYIKDGRTMVPVRFISETFDMEVDWDEEQRSVYIHYYEADASKLSYYDGFTYIPDFGAYFGYEPEQKKDNIYYYKDVSDEAKKDYDKLLKALGFEVIDQYTTSDISSFGYERGGEQIITMDTVIGEDNIFAITVRQKSPGIDEGNIKYYKNHPSAIDFGAAFGIEDKDTRELNYEDINSDIYLYDRSADGVDVSIEISDYLDAAKRHGFTVLYQYGYITSLSKDNTNINISMEYYPIIAIEVIELEDNTMYAPFSGVVGSLPQS